MDRWHSHAELSLLHVHLYWVDSQCMVFTIQQKGVNHTIDRKQNSGITHIFVIPQKRLYKQPNFSQSRSPSLSFIDKSSTLCQHPKTSGKKLPSYLHHLIITFTKTPIIMFPTSKSKQSNSNEQNKPQSFQFQGYTRQVLPPYWITQSYWS